MFKFKTITHSAVQTKKLAKILANKLSGGETIALIGDLGSGKTTFTQGLADGLGIKEKITSPSFVLMRVHPTKSGRVRQLCHLDLYRLGRINDIKEIGFEDYLTDQKTVTIIEWAERMGELSPKQKIEVKFTNLSQNQRKIEISGLNQELK